MTVVEDPFVAGAPDASTHGRVFGDAFTWYPADDERGFAVLESIDPSGFDAATIQAWAIGVEQLRRQTTAAGIAVADHLDATLPFRDQGFFTAKAWMKHRLQLSGAEAHGRVQQAKLRRAAHVWNNALAGGHVGVAQTRLMGRIAANPRIPTDVLTTGACQPWSTPWTSPT